ncbi:zinc-ribbon domain-containing protein [Acidovorax sp. NCPPB 2350]|nr:zinc-ribbon domain-containing protein [Acidovorax sp. NCPPB 2350]
MSQITRCPACGTTFKVVADQLRISEGWVRCGQCKEVFDAAAHLVPSAARGGELLSDLALPDKPKAAPRPAPAPQRAWGGGVHHPSPPQPPAAPAVVPVASHAPQAAQDTVRPAPAAPAESPPAFGSPSASPLSPAPAVPPFLVAAAPTDRRQEAPGGAAPAPDWGLEPLSLLAWRSRSPTSGPAPTTAGQGEAPMPSSPQAGPAPVAPAVAPSEPVDRDSLGGYELPFAELRDSGWPEDDGEDGMREDAVPLPGRPALTESTAPDDGAGVERENAVAQSVVMGVSHEAIDTDTDPVDVATQAMVLPDPSPEARKAQDAGVAGTPPEAAPSVWRSARADSPRPPGVAPARGHRDLDDDEDDENKDEPGFVRAARRKAWWRRPAVRAALGVSGVLLLGVLLLQVGLQERDRIAAQYPALRPALQALCTPLRCHLSAPRRIGDVVIDSSSFNKARGEGYQLALTIKSRADFPVAMPALELTLTDAQERPVLRRVLLPQDLSAPTELAAGGEWGGSWPVSVASVGGRVAGYRLLAFYP